MAAAAFARRYVQTVRASVMGRLVDRGFFFDPLAKEVETAVLPEVTEGALAAARRVQTARQLADALIKAALHKGEARRQAEADRLAAERAEAARLAREEEERRAAEAAAAAQRKAEEEAEAKRKAEAGEDEEDEDEEAKAAREAAAAAAAAPPVVSNNAMDVWKVLVGPDEAAEADVRAVMARMAVRLRGYGEPQLRFATGVMEGEGGTGLSEADLWAAITACAPRPLEGVQLTHLRRLWRTAETWLPALPEEEEAAEEEEGAAEAMAAAKQALEEAKAGPRRVTSESWLGLLAEDEFAASLLLPEVEVPKEDAPEGGADEDAEDEDE